MGKSNRKKIKKTIGTGMLYINANEHNVFITLTELNQQVLGSWSGGFVRQGKRKSMREKLSPEAILRLANSVIQKCKELDVYAVKIITKVSLRYLIMLLLNELYIKGLKFLTIKSSIPFSHNGLRGKKLKRK